MKGIHIMNLTQITNLNEEQAREYIEKIIWKKGAVCTHCGCKKVYKNKGKSARNGLYDCSGCKKQFSVTIGTIMHGSHIKLRQWAMAFHLLCSSKKGMSSLQLQRNLGLGSYRTALFMTHRIRLAMSEQPVKDMLKGTVEVDESYFGGKPQYKGTSKTGRGTKKIPVLVMVERNGRATSKRIMNVSGKTLRTAIRQTVDRSSTIMTDEWKSYNGIGKHFEGGHEVVNHGRKEYFRNGATTNTAESYFAIMKRGIMGVYHSVSSQHLDRYCDEFSFRWNRRKITDGERTDDAIKNAQGKRLTYSQEGV